MPGGYAEGRNVVFHTRPAPREIENERGATQPFPTRRGMAARPRDFHGTRANKTAPGLRARALNRNGNSWRKSLMITIWNLALTLYLFGFLGSQTEQVIASAARTIWRRLTNYNRVEARS